MGERWPIIAGHSFTIWRMFIQYLLGYSHPLISKLLCIAGRCGVLNSQEMRARFGISQEVIYSCLVSFVPWSQCVDKWIPAIIIFTAECRCRSKHLGFWCVLQYSRRRDASEYYCRFPLWWSRCGALMFNRAHWFPDRLYYVSVVMYPDWEEGSYKTVGTHPD